MDPEMNTVRSLCSSKPWGHRGAPEPAGTKLAPPRQAPRRSLAVI
jgi:hypothetical protein